MVNLAEIFGVFSGKQLLSREQCVMYSTELKQGAQRATDVLFVVDIFLFFSTLLLS